MPRRRYLFDLPDRFVAGTVGEPGKRTFFLQARSGARVTSVALEKQQVVVLAERIEELLDELLRAAGGESSIPAVSPVALEDNDAQARRCNYGRAGIGAVDDAGRLRTRPRP